LTSPDLELSAPRLKPAPDLARALEEAGTIARGVAQPVSTTHVLLALFTVPNPAAVLLHERGVDENSLLDHLTGEEIERPLSVRAVLKLAEETAVRCDARQVNTLHLLVGMMRAKDTVAFTLLEQSVDKLQGFRNTVMSYLTGVLPRRLLDHMKESKDETRDRGRPAPSTTKPRVRPLPRPRRQAPGDDWVVPKKTMLDAGSVDAKPEASARDGAVDGLLAGATSAKPIEPRAEKPAALRAERPNAQRGERPSARRAEQPSSKNGLPDPEEDESGLSPRPITRAPTLLPTAYDLDPDRFPWLVALGRNLSSLAEHSLLDPAVGRAKEIEQIIDVLGKRRANNPCLVGEPGVGKTAIAEGLAVKLVRGDADVAPLRGKIIVELDMGRILAGTSLRGSFSERLQGLKKDVERAKGRVIVFIDEIHTIMGAGASGDGPQDAANELKAALARGAFPVIGSTTLDEYRRHIESDPALERRFVRILIEEPRDRETIDILRGVAPLYEKHHGVKLDDDAIFAAVQLSTRFVHDRKLPGKAIDMLDLAMSRARRAALTKVTREEVARVCADVAKVPLERVRLEDARRFLEMENELAARVVGHAPVVAKVSETIRRNYAGFAQDRPLGSFLFLGPSGVGKTELAKAIADFLYGRDDALVRIDMSELSEAHSVARLVGAPPGYVGHQEGGQLTEAIRRRPHAVVLLDEIEKAHSDVLPLLLQILDEGRLTDSKGRKVTFRHAVVVMTSNLGASEMQKKAKTLGFGAQQASATVDDEAVVEAARKHFAPELFGRIEQKLVFRHLTKDELTRIAEHFMRASARALESTRNIALAWDEAVLAHLVEACGTDPAVGARPMRATTQKLVETPLADAILRGEVQEGERVRLVVREGHIVATKRRKDP